MDGQAPERKPGSRDGGVKATCVHALGGWVEGRWGQPWFGGSGRRGQPLGRQGLRDFSPSIPHGCPRSGPSSSRCNLKPLPLPEARNARGGHLKCYGERGGPSPRWRQRGILKLHFWAQGRRTNAIGGGGGHSFLLGAPPHSSPRLGPGGLEPGFDILGLISHLSPASPLLPEGCWSPWRKGRPGTTLAGNVPNGRRLQAGSLVPFERPPCSRPDWGVLASQGSHGIVSEGRIFLPGPCQEAAAPEVTRGLFLSESWEGSLAFWTRGMKGSTWHPVQAKRGSGKGWMRPSASGIRQPAGAPPQGGSSQRLWGSTGGGGLS